MKTGDRVIVIAQPRSLKTDHLRRKGRVLTAGPSLAHVELDRETYSRNGRDRKPKTVSWPLACFRVEVPR